MSGDGVAPLPSLFRVADRASAPAARMSPRTAGGGHGEAQAGGRRTGGWQQRHSAAPQDRQTARSGQSRHQVFSWQFSQRV